MLHSETNEVVISAIVADVARKMNLTEEQEIKLSQYPDHLVEKAYKAASGKQLDSPFNYMFKICSVEAGKEADRPKVTRLEPVAKQKAVNSSTGDKPWLPARPNPWQHLSKLDNLNRWDEYESSKKVQDYINHFGQERIDKQKGDYLGLLSKQDNPEGVAPTEPKDDFFAPMTAVQIAQEIRVLHPMSNQHEQPLLHGMPARIIANYCNKDYVPTNDGEEQVALMVIDRYRVKFGLNPRVLLDLQPEPEVVLLPTNPPPVSVYPVDYAKEIEGELTTMTVACNIITALAQKDDAKVNWLLDQEYTKTETKGESASESYINRIKKERGWVKKDVNVSSQPKTQQDKNLSTNSKFERVYSAKVQGYKIKETEDSMEFNYNPFDEEEYLDTPVNL